MARMLLFSLSYWKKGKRMPETQYAVQMGMGTDLKGQDYTKAAAAAVRDALRRNLSPFIAHLTYRSKK